MRPELLRALDLETGDDVLLAGDEDPDVRWGIAEFIAAEEMERRRGHWWAPRRRAVDRVPRRRSSGAGAAHRVADRARRDARAVRYPQAGTSNAIVTLHVLGIGGLRVDVAWDRDAFEYVVAVSWTEEGPPLALVQSRDQRDVQVLAIDPTPVRPRSSGGPRRPMDAHHGVPAWLPGDRLLTAGHRDDTRLLLIDDEPATPPACRSTACSTPATRCGSPEPESRPSCTWAADRRRVGGTGERRRGRARRSSPEISACW